MKAISLWQPWASLMAVGIKLNETRHWATSYRGDIAICAAKRSEPISAELRAVIWERRDKFPYAGNLEELLSELPRGAVLCVVALHDIRTTDWERERINPAEFASGNYAPGRFAWRTANLRTLREPVPAVGRQSLFNLPPDVEARVRAQLKQFPATSIVEAPANPEISTLKSAGFAAELSRPSRDGGENSTP